MVLGCITYDGVGTLCLVDGNITALKCIDTLDEHLWQVIARHFSNKPYLFQDDNAPVHKARITCEYKVNNNIPSITWPAQSPDINITENIWLKIKRSPQSMTRDITTKDYYFYVLLDIWQKDLRFCGLSFVIL